MERWLVSGGLALATLVLFALLLRSYAALRASAAPWAYAGATLDPRQLPALLPPATWTTAPATAATAMPVLTSPMPAPPPQPTATPVHYSANCGPD
ncbi:MAG: hypothetical protein IT318_21730 [Anaerolineales bacterium]|nr:hypothetical protein [Anaerolineales bacterium]